MFKYSALGSGDSMGKGKDSTERTTPRKKAWELSWFQMVLLAFIAILDFNRFFLVPIERYETDIIGAVAELIGKVAAVTLWMILYNFIARRIPIKNDFVKQTWYWFRILVTGALALFLLWVMAATVYTGW